ncbi:uncharacterized protein ARMOST_20584 [Armillaria ostoyae]|uniref:Uncharacterized protein n=1 Tax=Armillaria ostoyae TaxID=47428 RepID=A0A284S7R8_ARMOS|nr:uncharacterized protein ARMOST_20584 [Armillaria ostoyae]
MSTKDLLVSSGDGTEHLWWRTHTNLGGDSTRYDYLARTVKAGSTRLCKGIVTQRRIGCRGQRRTDDIGNASRDAQKSLTVLRMSAGLSEISRPRRS